MPDYGLLREIKKELLRAPGISGKASSLRFSYLPIEGRDYVLGCVAYLQGVRRYA